MATGQSETVRQKRAARERVKALITSLPHEERARRSEAACRHLIDTPEVQAADALLMFAPLPDELDLWPALYALKDAGKRVVLPKCRIDRRELICVEVGDFEAGLTRGALGILEPNSGRDIDPDELDVVLSPGRAFDRNGNRVGRGAGYYDRFFARDGFRAFVCGVAFDCQMLPEIPVQPHDVPVDGIVTESGLVRIGE